MSIGAALTRETPAFMANRDDVGTLRFAHPTFLRRCAQNQSAQTKKPALLRAFCLQNALQLFREKHPQTGEVLHAVLSRDGLEQLHALRFLAGLNQGDALA